MINNFPYDKNTHSNPWLMNTNSDLAIIGPEGIPLTAGYIWSKEGKEREDLVNWVFKYYREKGFVKSNLTGEELIKEFNKLKNKNVNSVITGKGEISNSSSLCNDVYKHFVWEKYFSAKGDSNTRSVLEVFNDDALFLEVLKNRMGYCLSKEDGEDRPYVFTITDKMILQGIRSTSYGYNVSLFKPLIGKYLYQTYAKKRVFDYSAGWGARCLAAMSLNLEYYAVDPLTSSEVNNIIRYFNGKGFVVNGGSEDDNNYINVPKVDCIMSSPPYFDLEIYSEDETQSVIKYNQYENWINIYWSKTVENCMKILEKDGYFIVVVKDNVKKYSLANDMKLVCENQGLTLEKEMFYKTSTNHLSGKKQTGKVSKNSEAVMIMRKM